MCALQKQQKGKPSVEAVSNTKQYIANWLESKARLSHHDLYEDRVNPYLC